MFWVHLKYGILSGALDFFHCQLDRNQHADFPVWRLLMKQAHLQSLFQPLQSQMQFAITIPILQNLQVVEHLPSCDDCVDSIRNCVLHDWTIRVTIRLLNWEPWLNCEFRWVWTQGLGSLYYKLEKLIYNYNLQTLNRILPLVAWDPCRMWCAVFFR